MMKTITIYTAGTLGDHLPFITLAEGLLAYGYHVRMALNESMAEIAQNNGIEVVPLTNLEGGETEARTHAQAWDFWSSRRKPFLNDENREEQIIQQCRELVLCARESDLLITTSIRPQGYIAARATDVPWITVSMNPSAFFTSSRPEDQQEIQTRRLVDYQKSSASVMEILRRLGINQPLPPMTRAWMWAPLVLLASSPYFVRPDPNQLQPQANLVQTGFLYYEDPSWQNWQPDEELQAFCEADDPDERPLVLAFSSQPLEDSARILGLHARAAALLKRKLLVQRGWAGFSTEMLPEDVNQSRILFRDFLPHDWLFSHAAGVIQHGGIGSIARAIRQTCPLLIEPFGNDQFFNANRIRELGIGAVMHPYKTTPEVVARVLSEIVLNEKTKRSVSELCSKFQQENGVHNACQVIERYLNLFRQKDHFLDYPPIYLDERVWQQIHNLR